MFPKHRSAVAPGPVVRETEKSRFLESLDSEADNVPGHRARPIHSRAGNIGEVSQSDGAEDHREKEFTMSTGLKRFFRRPRIAASLAVGLLNLFTVHGHALAWNIPIQLHGPAISRPILPSVQLPQIDHSLSQLPGVSAAEGLKLLSRGQETATPPTGSGNAETDPMDQQVPEANFGTTSSIKPSSIPSVPPC